MRPPYFVKAKFVPWYRSVILAVGVVAAVTMWVLGTQDGPATGSANWAWVPLAGCTVLMLTWHGQAKREWEQTHPSR